ncbi:lymphocyte-specific protein 1 [Ctenodactylus gundi]
MAESLSTLGSEEQEELLGSEDVGLTTQWSVEDEEEAAREQRRRERDRQLQAQDPDGTGCSLEQPEQEALLKPSEVPELDEDEGFGDWSQKPEQRPQHWGPEKTPHHGEPPQHEDPENQEEDSPRQPECQLLQTPSPLALEGTGDLHSPPLSPTTKIGQRTESLNHSIEKSNNVKKSQPALPISKIDKRLEEYTQAIESAGRTTKLSRQASIDLPSMAVANTKNLWETGEVQTQSTAKTPSCKDIVAGDMSKKSLWEKKGGSKTSSTIKSTPSGKRYKFVATGHGKYEKVLVDEGSAP